MGSAMSGRWRGRGRCRRGRRSGAVDAREALEDPLALRLGNAGAVVLHGEHDLPVVLGERDSSTGRCGVADGVVGQVADQRGRAGRDRPTTRPAPTPLRSTRTRSSARSRRATRSTMSSRSTGSRRDSPHGALVGAGDEQQVVGEPLEADRLVEHAGVGREQVGLVRVGEVHLELGADAGERAAQLVGRIGDEPLLALSGIVDPLEHVVHGASEARDLVVAGRHRHPAVQVAAADGRHLGADGLDRTERPADDPPEHGGEGQEHTRGRRGGATAEASRCCPRCRRSASRR